MSKLPEKAVLDGSKIPKTTTGEMKEALGELHDYLKELLGEDSGDKESARLALGIDLEELSGNIDAKADRYELSSVAMTGSYDDLKDKPDLSERGVPIGTVAWFAMPVPPAGYLKCDGSAVGRETCSELFAAIGTTYGEGDGETTFNLPNLIGRFAEGSAIPGQYIKAGLPEITAYWNIAGSAAKSVGASGAAIQNRFDTGTDYIPQGSSTNDLTSAGFVASQANPVYGNSDTVQPPALTLLPCIKAFDAAIDSGLIDITELANEVAGKADKTQVANLAMPSDSAVALTIPSSGSSITAPADGYINFTGTAGDQPGSVNLYSETVGSMVSMPAGYAGKALLPVREGAIVNITYTNLHSSTLYFVYAEGSRPV